jgi:peptidyl-prolyl cis-trans isomerase C
MKSYEVAHILVKAKYEADDIYKKLNEGLSFDSLAQKHSLCSSAKHGGYLGKIKIGQADEDFEQSSATT